VAFSVEIISRRITARKSLGLSRLHLVFSHELLHFRDVPHRGAGRRAGLAGWLQMGHLVCRQLVVMAPLAGETDLRVNVTASAAGGPHQPARAAEPSRAEPSRAEPSSGSARAPGANTKERKRGESITKLHGLRACMEGGEEGAKYTPLPFSPWEPARRRRDDGQWGTTSTTSTTTTTTRLF